MIGIQHCKTRSRAYSYENTNIWKTLIASLKVPLQIYNWSCRSLIQVSTQWLPLPTTHSKTQSDANHYGRDTKTLDLHEYLDQNLEVLFSFRQMCNKTFEKMFFDLIYIVLKSVTIATNSKNYYFKIYLPCCYATAAKFSFFFFWIFIMLKLSECFWWR